MYEIICPLDTDEGCWDKLRGSRKDFYSYRYGACDLRCFVCGNPAMGDCGGFGV
jgi:hypothetical protein